MLGQMTDPGFDLTGKRALVTGGSAGIGGAIATRLARAGAEVVAVSRSGGLPESGGLIHALVADLSDSDQVDGVVERSVEVLGGLDIVINNAGRSEWRLIEDLDRRYFDDLVSFNLWVPLRLCQLAYPHLARSGDAAVVMVGSIDAQRPSAGGSLYGATKAALGAATIALAKEWRTDGIRVVQVNPGLIDTPMAAGVVDDLARSGDQINVVGRVGTGDEIAGLVHYLVAPVGRFATGASYLVDGGALAVGPFDMRDV